MVQLSRVFTDEAAYVLWWKAFWFTVNEQWEKVIIGNFVARDDPLSWTNIVSTSTNSSYVLHWLSS